MKTTNRNLLPTSPMFDSVEIVREQTILDGTPVNVRTDSANALEISQCEAVVSQALKPEVVPRNPQIISGAIRERAEMIVSRAGVSARDVASVSDAQRILALLDELDSSLLQSPLRDSMRGRR